MPGHGSTWGKRSVSGLIDPLRHGGGHQNQHQAKKRSRNVSSDNEDPEMLDALIGILREQKNMNKFVGSICEIPNIKSRLIKHFFHPFLDDQL